MPLRPGPIESERHHEIARNNAALKSPGATESFRRSGVSARRPTLRMQYCFSRRSQSSFITGITLQVDGGGTAAI
jgi:hypothetical protein